MPKTVKENNATAKTKGKAVARAWRTRTNMATTTVTKTKAVIKQAVENDGNQNDDLRPLTAVCHKLPLVLHIQQCYISLFPLLLARCQSCNASIAIQRKHIQNTSCHIGDRDFRRKHPKAQSCN